MVPKDGRQDIHGFDNLSGPHRTYTSPNLRRRHGPITRQPSASEAFRLGCMKGDHVVVRHLIESGRVNVNCAFEDGWTPLMIAASAARPTVLEYLLSKYADPNAVRKDFVTALMAATGSSQLRTDDILCCVTALIESGAAVDAKDNNGMTPLGFAVRENKREVALCLIEAGADVDSLDKNGRTCLFHAAEKGYGQMARLLLESGASIDIVDRSGWMVCEVAVDKGHMKLGELLFRVRESQWRPGRSPHLMTAFNDVPDPIVTEPEADTGEGIVNSLTSIQTQVRCLSNLVNSVRLRMSQDMITRKYEVEPGKMGELAVFARSMRKSCAILINEVCSLNILTDGDIKTTEKSQADMYASPSLVDSVLQESRKTILPSTYFPPDKKEKGKSGSAAAAAADSSEESLALAHESERTLVPPKRNRNKKERDKKEHLHNRHHHQQHHNPDSNPPEKDNIVCSKSSSNCKEDNNYLNNKKSKKWDVMLAGAAGVVLLCFFAPNFKGRLGSIRLWQL